MKKIKKSPKKLAKKLPPAKSGKTTLREDIGKVLIDVGKLICCPLTLDSLAVFSLGVSCVARHLKLYWQ